MSMRHEFIVLYSLSLRPNIMFWTTLADARGTLWNCIQRELRAIVFSPRRLPSGTGATSTHPENGQMVSETAADILIERLTDGGAEARLDLQESPMPAPIDLGNAKNFATSPIMSQPHGEKIAMTAVSDKVRELL